MKHGMENQQKKRSRGHRKHPEEKDGNQAPQAVPLTLVSCAKHCHAHLQVPTPVPSGHMQYSCNTPSGFVMQGSALGSSAKVLQRDLLPHPEDLQNPRMGGLEVTSTIIPLQPPSR